MRAGTRQGNPPAPLPTNVLAYLSTGAPFTSALSTRISPHPHPVSDMRSESARSLSSVLGHERRLSSGLLVRPTSGLDDCHRLSARGGPRLGIDTRIRSGIALKWALQGGLGRHEPPTQWPRNSWGGVTCVVLTPGQSTVHMRRFDRNPFIDFEFLHPVLGS